MSVKTCYTREMPKIILPDELIADKIQESVERITNRSVPHPPPHAPVKLHVLDEPGAVIGDDTTFCRPGPSLLGPVPLPFKASPAVCSQLLYLVIKSLWNPYICPYTSPKVIPAWRDAKRFAETCIKKMPHFFLAGGETKKGWTWPPEFFCADKLCHRGWCGPQDAEMKEKSQEVSGRESMEIIWEEDLWAFERSIREPWKVDNVPLSFVTV